MIQCSTLDDDCFHSCASLQCIVSTVSSLMSERASLSFTFDQSNDAKLTTAPAMDSTRIVDVRSSTLEVNMWSETNTTSAVTLSDIEDRQLFGWVSIILVLVLITTVYTLFYMPLHYDPRMYSQFQVDTSNLKRD